MAGHANVLASPPDCSPPRPAGPFSIAPGASVAIDFRNVFAEDYDFLVATDTPAVFAATPAGSLRLAKKSSTTISVRFAPPPGSDPASYVASGKLIVACPGLPGTPPWVYYLRGEPPGKVSSGSAASAVGSGAAAAGAGQASKAPAPAKKKP